eukprot:134762-Hanusia_phi.AAC.1
MPGSSWHGIEGRVRSPWHTLTESVTGGQSPHSGAAAHWAPRAGPPETVPGDCGSARASQPVTVGVLQADRIRSD